MNNIEKAAIIVGLVECLKNLMPSALYNKICPLLAVLFGIVLSFDSGVNYETFIDGIILGLTTTGLYKVGTERVFNHKKNEAL